MSDDLGFTIEPGLSVSSISSVRLCIESGERVPGKVSHECCDTHVIDSSKQGPCTTDLYMRAADLADGTAGVVRVPPVGEVMRVVVGVNAYEVGYAYDGCADDPESGHQVVEKQRGALQALLTAFGGAMSGWHLAPEIRAVHNHTAVTIPADFGKHLAVNRAPCVWCVYGVVLADEPPTVHYVPEGVRIPNLDHE